MKLNKWYLGLMNYLSPAISFTPYGRPYLGGSDYIGSLQNQGTNQAAIDAAIKKQLESQNLVLTNNIVKQSVNVPYRNPASYFQGFSGSPYMQSAQGNNQVPMARNASAFMNQPSAPNESQNMYQTQLQELMKRFNLLGQ